MISKWIFNIFFRETYERFAVAMFIDSNSRHGCSYDYISALRYMKETGKL